MSTTGVFIGQAKVKHSVGIKKLTLREFSFIQKYSRLVQGRTVDRHLFQLPSAKRCSDLTCRLLTSEPVSLEFCEIAVVFLTAWSLDSFID